MADTDACAILWNIGPIATTAMSARVYITIISTNIDRTDCVDVCTREYAWME